MAYIPPHKRHSRDDSKPSPIPERMIPERRIPSFRRNMSVRSPFPNPDRSGKIVYGDGAVVRWMVVGLDGADQLASCAHLEPISVEAIERRMGEKPFILVNHSLGEGHDLGTSWAKIVENVQQDLYSSFEVLKNKVDDHEELKPTLVARFGNVLFHPQTSPRSSSLKPEEKIQVEDSALRGLKRSFYTNVPLSYTNKVLDEVVPKLGLDFEKDEGIYHVKLSDKTRPDSTLSCKCRLMENKGLMLHKVELNQVRQMVTDVSCLDKDLDLRIMLCTKRILRDLSEDEMNCIKNVIDSAVADPDVKGGLRWPLGKEASGDRYRVIGVWRITTKSFIHPSFRLKVRNADRYDFKTGVGEVTREVNLKLKRLASEMLEENVESDSIVKMLQDSLKLIWDNFLGCERFLV